MALEKIVAYFLEKTDEMLRIFFQMPGRGKKRGRSAGSTNETPKAKKKSIKSDDTNTGTCCNKN